MKFADNCKPGGQSGMGINIFVARASSSPHIYITASWKRPSPGSRHNSLPLMRIHHRKLRNPQSSTTIRYQSKCFQRRT